MQAVAHFTSDRERRLWLLTAAAVTAIYSTLGVARPVVDVLREANLLRLAIVSVIVVLLGPITWRWVRSRPDWSEVGAVFGVVFAYWMVWVRISGWAERTHLIEYGVVAAVLHMALLERTINGRYVPVPAFLAVTGTTLIGFLDETIQSVLPSRVFDIRDVFFNLVAAFLVIAARLALVPQERPGWRVWFLWLWATAFGWGQGVYWGWYTAEDPKILEATPSDLVAGYLGVVTGGLLVGVLQWLVLRRHISGAYRWVAASLGALLAVASLIAGFGVVDTDLGWIVGVGLFGPLVGSLQWAVLRRQVPRSGWWMPVTTVGWLVGIPFGDINGPPGLGAAYGAITATALVWLLRQREIVAPTPLSPVA